MEQIVLEVDAALAMAWNNTTPALRLSYERKISDLLRELKETEFDTLFDNGGETALASRLIQEQPDTVLKEGADDKSDERYEWWNDQDVMAELDQISDDLKSGKDPGFTMEESKARLLAYLKGNGLHD